MRTARKSPSDSHLDAWRRIDKSRFGLELAPQRRLAQGMGVRDQSWKMVGKKFPYSCTDEEGSVLYDVLTENYLKSGYEIATAFGYSSLYLALACAQTNGSFVSMDCYVEEGKEDYHYTIKEMRRATQETRRGVADGAAPRGLTIARENLSRLGLKKEVEYVVGLSPEDVSLVLGPQRLDFAFIDGGHFSEQPTHDVEAVIDRFGSKYAVFFHDNNSNQSVERAIERAANALNGEVVVFNTKYNLTLVHRGLTTESLHRINNRLIRNSYRGRMIKCGMAALRGIKTLISK